MKILRLDLRAFGPFTDVEIDLSAGTEGLHIVYGPNEAGKSSALRAIRAMLYGIPQRTDDDFRHAYDKLAVGGTLQLSDGRTLPFLRIKRQNNTLRQPDGQAAIEDAALDPFLQGVPESQFQTLFGIDHDELTKGGKSILKGENELGQLLFAAGTGLTSVRQILGTLQDEYEALFKAKAQKPAINQAITRHDAAQTEARKATLPSEEWEKHDGLLRHAREEAARLEARLSKARRTLHQLERIQQAAPLLAQRRLNIAQLAKLGEPPPLPDDFRERWRKTGNGLELARRAQTDAETEAQGFSEKRKAIAVPYDLLALADLIDPLRDDLAQYRTDRQNRPAHAADRDRADEDATRGFRELGLDPNQPPYLTRTQRDAIQRLSRTLPSARKECDRIAGDREKATTDRRQFLAERAAMPESAYPEALALALDRARGAGDLDGLLNQLSAAIEQATSQIAKNASKLKHWNGPVEQLDALPLPSLDEIETAHDAFHDLDTKLDRDKIKLDEARERVAEAEAAILQLRLSGDVPTESDLAALREHRDTLWASLRRHFLDAEPLNSRADLVADYELDVRQADDLADRLRREADRVAQLAQRESERRRAADQAANLAERHAEARSRRDAAQESWNALWSPAGIAPSTPRAMRDWLAKSIEPLRTKLAEREKAQDDYASATAKRESFRADLDVILAALGAPPLDAESSLSATIDNAQATLNRLRQITQKQQEIDRDLRKIDDHLETLRSQQEDADTARNHLETEWAQTVAVLGLAATATPEQATGALETLIEAVKSRESARKLDREIAKIDSATSGFVERLNALAGRVVPPITDPDPEAIAQALVARLDDAREQEKAAETLDQNLANVLEKERLARETVARHEVAMRAIVQEAACQVPEEVPAMLAAVEAARPLRETIAGIEQGLLQSGRGATLEQIAEEVESIPADELETRLEQIHPEIVSLETRLAEQQNTIGAEQNELARMDGNAAAAVHASQANAIAAQLTSQADQYIRLKLAAALLKEGIERHRQRNQGPILGRAGDYFARLTRGSFSGLQVDEDPKGEPALVGTRVNGEIVQVNGLSLGTADALYLALRLAGLEVYLDAHPPMPLIVDDILIQFDDDRAMAALEALATLSNRTQILFFTHHRRLVDLANTLDPSTRFLHELPGPIH